MAMEWANRRDTLIKQMDKMDELIGRTNGPWGVHPEDGRKILTAQTLIVPRRCRTVGRTTKKAIKLAYKEGKGKFPWE